MQAGSDSVLAAMNRRYTCGRYFELVDYMRSKIPDIAITTDIIVGFPGETEEDFEKTLDALRYCRFDGVFSFIYSPRKGTPAAEMDGQIPDEITRDRMARLLELQMQIQTENNEKLVGKCLRALCEGESKNDPNFLSARSDSGKLIHFAKPDESVSAGEIVTLRITEARAIMLIGEIVR